MKRSISKKSRGESYPVEAGQVMNRMADYGKGRKLQKKFTSITPPDDFSCCGNVTRDLYVHKETLRATFDKNITWQHPDYYNHYEVISAALLLYRLICLFPNPVVICEGANGYKVPWAIYLEHKKTGHIICLSEWKGSFSLRTTFYDSNDMPEDLKEDLLMLLDLIFSNNSPHPYDDVVAGSMA